MAKKKSGKSPNGMGSIYKDGDGYRVAVQVGHDPTTGRPKYRKVRVASHEEAVSTLKKLQAEQHAGRLSAAARMTVSSYLAHWLDTKVKPPMRAPSTYRQYAWIIQDHIEPLLGKKALDKVTRAEVQRMISAKVDQKVSARGKEGDAGDRTLSRSTLRLIRAVLHAAYEDAIKDGLVGKNPAEYVEVPVAPKKPTSFLKPNEATLLSRALLGTELECLLRLMLSTGLRVGEATGVRWKDLDLEAGTVHICGQLQRLDGRLEYRATTKTNQDRVVPISQDLAQRLLALRTEQLVNGVGDPDGLAFLNAEGRRLDPKYVSGRLKEVCVAASVPVVSPHKLRHTAATLALVATGDLYAVQKMLGHQQQSLTADLYGHGVLEGIRRATEGIESLLNK